MSRRLDPEVEEELFRELALTTATIEAALEEADFLDRQYLIDRIDERLLGDALRLGSAGYRRLAERVVRAAAVLAVARRRRRSGGSAPPSPLAVALVVPGRGKHSIVLHGKKTHVA